MPTSRTDIENDLLRWSRTDRDRVVAAGRDLGFAGRTMKSLDDAELLRLHVAVYLLLATLTPDESSEGRVLNERCDALLF